jgi:hypothetical protein
MAAASLLIACAPALDWRDVRPEGSGATVLFPCKPDSHARKVALGAHEVRLALYACTAAGATWALAYADMADPVRVSPALRELQASAARNLDATEASPLALKVEGATPNPYSQRVQIQGVFRDGRGVTEQLAVFANGTRVFQATVVSEKLDAEAAEIFFSALRVAP